MRHGCLVGSLLVLGVHWVVCGCLVGTGQFVFGWFFAGAWWAVCRGLLGGWFQNNDNFVIP